MTFLSVEFILDALVRSSFIAIVGILLYVWQTKSKTRENKRDMARILRNEVRRVLDILPSRENARILFDNLDRIPSDRVYSGLLQTGNIRFFDDELQNKMDAWYSFIDEFDFKIDVDAGIDLIGDLEQMEQENRTYRRALVKWLVRS